jgi:hypothetical protein
MPARKEFRRAPRLLFGAVVLATALLYFEYHLVYPPVFSTEPVREAAFSIRTEHLFIHTVAAAGFIATTRRFMQYDAQTQVAVFGERGTGKSTTAYGSLTGYLKRVARHLEVPPLDVSQDLYELVGYNENAAVDNDGPGPITGEWFIPNNEQNDIEEYEWTIREGHIFPKNVRISILDYAGENLKGFVEVISGTPLKEINVGNPDVIRALQKQAEEADSIVLLVDVEALRSSSAKLNASLYADIVAEYRDDKEIYFAATKADLYDAEFRQQTSLDIYDIGNLEQFTRFVTHEIMRESDVISGLMADSEADLVYPLYVRTVETAAGTRKPVVNEDGDLQPYGYVQLLDTIK